MAGKTKRLSLVDDDDPEFARFWAHYPKRFNKKDARLAWSQLRPTSDVVDRMLETLDWQTTLSEWLRDGGRFIPYPASWLRAERWHDERPPEARTRRGAAPWAGCSLHTPRC